jgi:hopanoid biosynthesis associated RND transporter like protein HpnN
MFKPSIMAGADLRGLPGPGGRAWATSRNGGGFPGDGTLPPPVSSERPASGAPVFHERSDYGKVHRDKMTIPEQRSGFPNDTKIAPIAFRSGNARVDYAHGRYSIAFDAHCFRFWQSLAQMTVSPAVTRIVSFSCRRPLTIVLASFVLVGFAIVYAATHFAMDTNTTALIAPDVKWRQDEADLKRTFPEIGDVTLVIVDGTTPERAEAAAAALTVRLAADTAWIRAVRRPDGGDFFARNGLLFGSVDDVRAAAAGLAGAQPLLAPLAADPSLRGIATALDGLLSGVEAGAIPLDRAMPTIGGIADALERQAAGEPTLFSWARLFGGGDQLATPTRRLILVRPVLDYGALMPGESATVAIFEAARALGLDPDQGVTVRVTGAVPLADEEFGSLLENISFVGLVMLAAMLLILWFAVGSVRIVAAIMFTILVSLAITTALGLAAVKTINLISIAFIPLFVGLGVDFGIQLAVRFNAERLTGDAPAVAMTRAAEALGGPLLLAASAIFLGFGAFLPTDYVGIAELGVIAGLGMVIALGLSLTLLPALLMLFRPGRPQGDVGFAWLAPADRWLERRRVLVLWSFAIAMMASIATLPLVTFDFNPLHLRNPAAPSMTALADLMRDPLRTPNAINIIAPDRAAAAAIAARARAIPEVAQAITVDSFVPADQAEKLAELGAAKARLDPALHPPGTLPPPSDEESAAALADTAVRLRRAASDASGAPAASAERLAAAFGRLATAPPEARTSAASLLVEPLTVMLGQVGASLQAAPVTHETLPSEIVRDWIAPDGRARVQIFPKGDSNDNAVIERFTRAVRALAPNATGAAVTTQEAAHTVARAFVEAGVLALALVTLLLFAVLRDIREVAFTLAPVVLAGFLTLGTCVVIGQPLNFANIIAFPLLFGVGVAFHIYFVMAWRGGATGLLQSSLARAVLFSAIATGTAFGSLWLSTHPGTASMGKILMLSLAWTLVCALVFEPALLGPPRRKRPRPTQDVQP